MFLRGQDADDRARELVWQRAGARPLLGDLAIALIERKGHEALGFRSLADWSRERIGVGARTAREWARVGRALAELPRLRRAVRSGEVSWTVARLVVKHTTPENEEAVLATVRGRTVRAVEILLRAAFPGESKGCEQEGSSDDERVAVSVSCSREVSTKWIAALELARRVAGEQLPAWECAEAIAAECASAVAVDENERPHAAKYRTKSRAARAGASTDRESGFRALVWPHLRCLWRGPKGNALLEHLGRGSKAARRASSTAASGRSLRSFSK